MSRTALLTLLALALLGGCAPKPDGDATQAPAASTPTAAPAAEPAAQQEAQAFLDGYTAKFVELAYTANLAEWDLNTHIVEGDDTNRLRNQTANEALAAYTGSSEVIEKTRALLAKRDG